MTPFSMRRMVFCATLLASASRRAATAFGPSFFAMQRRPPTMARTTTTRLWSSVDSDISKMRVGELKKELESYGISTKSFLEKSELVAALTTARQQQGSKSSSSSSESTSSSSSSSTSTQQQPQEPRKSAAAGPTRDERLQQELADCRTMKPLELKRELRERNVDITALFEKSELVQALAEARVDGKTKNNNDSEGYAEYKNVEVLTDDASGPQKRSSAQPEATTQPTNPFGSGANPFNGGGNPFGGAAGGGGGNPFAGMGGMGGMGNIADLLGKMGGGGGNPFGGAGGNPFGGAGGGGGNPFGGGMPDMAKAQEMLQNPKVRELMAKAQSNPRIMQIVQECMGNPAAMAKYSSDPELKDLMAELKKYL